jgi:hypothetical protein
VKRYRVTYKSKDGSVQYVTVLAKDADDAKAQADASQARRHARFPLTFARLEQAKETGQTGMLAIDPKFGGTALTEAWVKAETERRKVDQARYDNNDLKIVSVGEVK